MSRLALFRQCQHSFRLDVEHDADVSTAARERGNVVHGAINAYVKDGPDPFVFESDMPAEVAERVDELRANGCEVYSEVAMAWDIAADSARVLGMGKDRDYSSAHDGDLCGTADLIVVDRKRSELLILDWKTAAPGVEPKDATDQLTANALAAARIWPMDNVYFAAPVVREDSVHWPEPTRIDLFELEGAAVDLRERLTADISQAQPNPGPHCAERYCQARGSCPATREAMTQVIPADRLAFKFGTSIESDQHAAWLLTVLDLLKAGIEVERARLESYADQNQGVTFTDGFVWKGSESKTTKPVLEVPGALDVVREAGAEDAIGYATTWAELERVLGKPSAKKLREQLTAMGAVKATSYTRYSRVKQKFTTGKTKEIAT